MKWNASLLGLPPDGGPLGGCPQGTRQGVEALEHCEGTEISRVYGLG